jgi:hypothetical protein
LQEQHILLVFSFLKRFDVLLAEAATWTKCVWNDFLAWLQHEIRHVSAGIWIALAAAAPTTLPGTEVGKS